MTLKEIIDGLQMTIDLCLYNPNTGETIAEPRNDMDKTTVDACKGAIELLSYGVQQPKRDNFGFGGDENGHTINNNEADPEEKRKEI